MIKQLLPNDLIDLFFYETVSAETTQDEQI